MTSTNTTAEATLGEQIVETLADHEIVALPANGWTCLCGRSDTGTGGALASLRRHQAHVAEEIAALAPAEAVA